MIVDPSGEIVGSVGGGTIERLSIEKALEALTTKRIEKLEFNLNDREDSQTGMVCGGNVKLLIEPIGIAPRLFLFGAGHVAQPTARLAGEVGFNVIIHDSRPEWANKERFPSMTIKTGDIEELAMQLDSTADDFIVIMTYSHKEDYKIAKQAIRKPFFYLGIIGSKRKATDIKNKLAKDGFTEEEISRITSPIGLDIGSHTPSEIAVSVTAQLISERRRWEKV